MTPARRRIAVVLGGRSSEHDVSVASAESVVQALSEAHEVVTVEIARDGGWTVALDPTEPRALAAGEASDAAPRAAAAGDAPGRARGGGGSAIGVRASRLPDRSVSEALSDVDVVFPVLHGPFGEDGTLQGLLELAGVPYVGAGVLASALCMDKDRFKAVMRDSGIPVTRNVTLREGDEPRNPFGYPVFVKPARLGSSIGISKAHDDRELRAAVELAFEHDDKVIVEEFVSGCEVEVGVLGNRRPIASLPGQIVVTHNEWYDYEAKYDEGEMELVVPPPIDPEQVERAQELAVRAFVAAECAGMARADMFVRDDGEVLVNELNTIPGFTATSVYAKLFDASGIPYAELLDRLVELAIDRHEARARLRY